MSRKLFTGSQESLDVPLLPFIHDNRENIQSVYSINKGKLPSNFRSVVLMKNHVIRDFKTSSNCHSCDLLCYMKPQTKVQLTQRVVTVIVLVTLISFTLTLTIWKLCFPESDNTRQKDKIVVTSETLEGDFLQKNRLNSWKNVVLNKKPNRRKKIQGRTPCRTKCFKYSAFKFRSTCHNGFCECHGTGYQKDTCLPFVEGCAIRRKLETTFTEAIFSGRKQALFTCVPKSTDRAPVHVFSMFENSNSNETIVDVKGTKQASARDVILVLASYRQTKWIINTYLDVTIKKLFLISTVQNEHLSVVWNDNQESVTETLVTRLRSQTGHGDDTCAGRHSVELLRTVTQEVGKITTFTGSKHADHWSFDLDRFLIES